MNDDGVQTAFEIILEEIGSVSKELTEDAKRLVDKHDFDAVSRLMGTAKKLDSFQLKVKALQKEWVQTFDLDTRARTHYEPVTVETTTSQPLLLTMTYAEATANAQWAKGNNLTWIFRAQADIRVDARKRSANEARG